MTLSNLNPLPLLRSAAQALRRLPVAKLIKPVWKYALQELVIEEGGNKAQEEVVKVLRSKAPDALAKANAIIDGLQERFKKLLHKLPFVPDGLEARVLEAVSGPVDALQERLRTAMASGGTEFAVIYVNAAFDKFQQDLKERVAQL